MNKIDLISMLPDTPQLQYLYPLTLVGTEVGVLLEDFTIEIAAEETSFSTLTDLDTLHCNQAVAGRLLRIRGAIVAGHRVLHAGRSRVGHRIATFVGRRVRSLVT